MIRVKSRYALHADNRSAPELRLSPVRRIGFAFSAILLITAAVIALVGPQQIEFSFGLVFYTALVLACLFVAGSNRRYIFNLANDTVYVRFSFFGFLISEKKMAMTELASIRVTALRMIGKESAPRSTVLNAGFGSYVEKRKMYFRFELVFRDSTEKIDDGSDGQDIHATAKTLASLINRPFLYEES